MSQRRENWVYVCLCVVIVLGSIFWFVRPVPTIFVVIIAILAIGIIYVYRAQSDESSTMSPSSSDSPEEKETLASIIETFQEQDSVLEPTLELDEKTPDSLVTPSALQSMPEKESKESIRALQERITELEKRVISLKQQLVGDPIPSSEDIVSASDKQEYREEELSEKATQQLLDTLDEKLAKGAISKQLYTQLRDKYIARMEKAKKRHKASAIPGKKDSITGDT